MSRPEPLQIERRFIMHQSSPDQSVPPPRTSLSARDAPQQGPIPLFDNHLTILTDSYLNFFQERFILSIFHIAPRPSADFGMYSGKRSKSNSASSAEHISQITVTSGAVLNPSLVCIERRKLLMRSMKIGVN